MRHLSGRRELSPRRRALGGVLLCLACAAAGVSAGLSLGHDSALQRTPRLRLDVPADVEAGPRLPPGHGQAFAVVRRYFDLLYETGYDSGFGTIGVQESYQKAFALISEQWPGGRNYGAWKEQFRGTALIRWVRIFPAGSITVGSEVRRRFFVELEYWVAHERAGQTGAALCYSWGTCTLRKDANAWRIAQVELEPETYYLVDAGGHQPWRGDPEMVAEFALQHRYGRGTRLTPSSWRQKDGYESVLAEVPGKGRVRAHLVQLVHGDWVVAFVEPAT